MNVRIGLSQINQLANEIGLLAHVISKLKMADIFKFRFKMADEDRQRIGKCGTNSTFSSSFSSKNLEKLKKESFVAISSIVFYPCF